MAIKDLIDKAAAKKAGAEEEMPPEEVAAEEPPMAEGEEAQADAELEEDDDGEGEANVSPEEQEMYETVVIAANSIIYGEDSAKVILQKLESEGGSPKIIGHTAAMIALSIKGGAEQQGRDIPPDVLMAAGQEIVANLVELCVAKGWVEEAEEPEVFKQAMFEGMKAYGDFELKTGKITPEVQAEAKAQMEALKNGSEGGAPTESGTGAMAKAIEKSPVAEEE